MSKPRHRAAPAVDRADITGDELSAIVAGATKNKVRTGGEEAEVLAQAINNHAYMLVDEPKNRAYRKKVLDAATLLLNHVNDGGYPFEGKVASLQTALEMAIPSLFERETTYNLEPYQGPTFVIHQLSCLLCEQAGFRPASSRTSHAIRITAAVLGRLGFVVTPAALEVFVRNWD